LTNEQHVFFAVFEYLVAISGSGFKSVDDGLPSPEGGGGGFSTDLTHYPENL
jgi:hypothetical protein